MFYVITKDIITSIYYVLVIVLGTGDTQEIGTCGYDSHGICILVCVEMEYQQGNSLISQLISDMDKYCKKNKIPRSDGA